MKKKVFSKVLRISNKNFESMLNFFKWRDNFEPIEEITVYYDKNISVIYTLSMDADMIRFSARGIKKNKTFFITGGHFTTLEELYKPICIIREGYEFFFKFAPSTLTYNDYLYMLNAQYWNQKGYITNEIKLLNQDSEFELLLVLKKICEGINLEEETKILLHEKLDYYGYNDDFYYSETSCLDDKDKIVSALLTFFYSDGLFEKVGADIFFDKYIREYIDIICS